MLSLHLLAHLSFPLQESPNVRTTHYNVHNAGAVYLLYWWFNGKRISFFFCFGYDSGFKKTVISTFFVIIPLMERSHSDICNMNLMSM